MAPESVRRIGHTELRLVRPFLAVWRRQVDAYVQAHEIAFREDESNEQVVHTRNRIRHLAIPTLCSAFGRDVQNALWRTAEMLRAEDEYMRTRLPDPAQGGLAVPTLRELPVALQRRVIHRWFSDHLVEDAGFAEVESLRALLYQKTAKVNLPRGLSARRQSGRIFLDQQ
jgi:tRNA(Ile)-lysidine synthase